MKTAFIRLVESMKFWTTVIAIIVTLFGTWLAKHGFDLSEQHTTQVAEVIALFFTMLLGGQALTDAGKEKAKIVAATPRIEAISGQVLETSGSFDTKTSIPPQSGFARLDTVLTVLMLGASIALVCSACGAFKSEAKHAAADVVDCTTKEASGRIAEYGPMIDDVLVTATAGDGTVDKDRVKSAIRGFATDTARCVLADAVARALSPKSTDPTAPHSSPLNADPLALRQVFSELGGGKTYQTPHGTL